jgi:BASS family bile acid:Na+ symporter
MPNTLDALRLNFSPDSLFLLNVCLGVIMFGIALDINIEDFKILLKNPKAALVGLLSQFIVLPFLTFLLILVWQPQASIAMGMILVAACPGGNISNFMSHLSKSNTALSVGLTTLATFASLLMTPLNFKLYASLYPPSMELLTDINLDEWAVIKTIFTIVLFPLLAGLAFRKWQEEIAKKISPIFRVASILIFIAFVLIAFSKNYDLFLQYIHVVALLVLLHNAIALGSGYGLGQIFALSRRDKRTISIETGIQNSGLGLVIIFAFFEGLGGMALVTAWWGIWHIIAGLSLAFIWSKSKSLT